MTKKIIFFDIDYTLFDTDKFRDVTYPKLTSLLEQEDTPEYHNMVKDAERLLIKSGGYEPVLFAKTLAKALSIPPESLAVEDLFYNPQLYDSCLYEETKETLRAISDQGIWTLGIVSQGEKTFQERKIASIRSFFSANDIYIATNKLDFVDKIANSYANYHVCVIDDSAPFLHAIKSANQQFTTCLVEKENRYEKRQTPEGFEPDFVIKSLGEAPAIIDNIDTN